MIRLFTTIAKGVYTYMVPWRYVDEKDDRQPFFRGGDIKLAVQPGFKPWFSEDSNFIDGALSDGLCHIIEKEGEFFLEPCSEDEDEKIFLIAVVCHRAPKITARKVEILGQYAFFTYSSDFILGRSHMDEVSVLLYILARAVDPEGHLTITDLALPESHVDLAKVDVFSWKGGHFRLDYQDYRDALTAGTLFEDRDTIAIDLADCAAARCRFNTFAPKFEAACAGYAFVNQKGFDDKPVLQMCNRHVNVWRPNDIFIGHLEAYDYSQEELDRFRADLPAIEAGFLKWKRDTEIHHRGR